MNTGNSVTSSGLIEAVHASLDFDDAVFNTFGTITADQGGTIDFGNGLTNGGIVNVHAGSEVDVRATSSTTPLSWIMACSRSTI